MAIKKFNEFNNNLLSFSYDGDLPNKDMIDWFNDNSEFNQEENFFDRFQEELMDLSYFQMLDIFNTAKNKSFR